MKKTELLLLFIFTLLSAVYSKLYSQQPVRIVCVGNSITEGFGNTSEEAAWPAQANKLLGNRYAISNCAVSGTTMFKNSNAPYWKTERYAKAKSLNPQILIIALGTNDADPWRWNSLKNEFKSDYLDMVKEFRQGGKDPVIYVCLPPPLFGPQKAAQNTVVENELIPLIKEIAGEIGAYIIDYHQPLINANKQFPDNVHPDDAGAVLMAQIAYDHIKKAQIIVPHVSVKKGKVSDETVAIVKEGGTVTFAPKPINGTWIWTGPNGFSSNNRVVTLKNVKNGGIYTAVHTNNEGQRSIINFLVSIKGREASPITPSIQNKNREWIKTNTLSTNPGTTIVLSPQTKDENGTWTWAGPNSFFACKRDIRLDTLTPSQAGEYIVTYTDKEGSQSRSSFFVTVEGEVVCPDLIPYININGKWQSTDVMEVKEGQNLSFGPHPFNGEWIWKGPDGFTCDRREASVSNFNSQKTGEYIGTFTNAAGCKVELIITLKLKK